MVNKKVIKYFSIICLTSLLLTGCTKDNEDIDINTKNNTVVSEEKESLNQLQEDINNGKNLSLTGNILDDNDDDRRYNLRLRILATHYNYTNLLMNIFPKPEKELLTDNHVGFTNEIQGYIEEATVIKGILHDFEELENFDVQFTEEEKFMNDNLDTLLDGSIQLLTDVPKMFKVEDESVYFDTENYTLKDYKEKYENYHALIDETFKTYALYGSNFLIRKESDLKVTEEMFDKLVLFKRHLVTDNEIILDQANLLIENKYKHGESVSLIKDYTHELLKKQSIKELTGFNDYFDLLQKIKNEDDIDNLIELLNQLIDYTENIDFINDKNYVSLNRQYLYNYIDYYVIL